MSTDARVPCVSTGVHRAERLGACVHVLCRRKVLEYHRRSLTFVVQHLQACRGDAGRRPFGLLDASEQAGDLGGARFAK